MFCEGALCGMGYLEEAKIQKPSAQPMMLLNVVADNSSSRARAMFSPVGTIGDVTRSKRMPQKYSQIFEFSWSPIRRST